MGSFDYYEGKFPYSSDVIVELSSGISAFVGRHTYGIELIELHSWGSKSSFSIGRFSSIARTQFFLAGNHPSHFFSQGLFLPKYFANAETVEKTINDDFSSNGNICIGSDVWIGNFSTIMSGVKIGDGAVVAANAHVVRDVMPYSIVGGNPARHIRFRFPEAVVELMIELKWWEFDDEIINNILTRLRAAVTLAGLKELLQMSQGYKRARISETKMLP
jgi:acetyltransferase-like isoleucine patch superfamily enzyme